MTDAGDDRYTELELIQLVEEVIRHLPNSQMIATHSPVVGDLGFDLAFNQGNRTYLVDVRRVVPQTVARLNEIQRQLLAARSSFEKQSPGRDIRLALATPGIIAEQKVSRLNSIDFEIWDREWIRQHVVEFGITGGIADVFGREYRQGETDSRERELANRLRAVRCGSRQWSVYQKLCSDIFEYLFNPPLEPPIYESFNEPRVNRRDFIMPNYAVDGFWRFLRSHYQADYLVVDAKNHCDAVGKDEVLQLANYLSRHGTGLFGVITTRAGIDSGGSYICREQWILHNKMVIVLDDRDLLQMLETKGSGDDPGILVRQKIEDFRLGM